MWLNALRELGAEVELTDSGRTLTLRRGRDAVSWQTRRLRRTPRPSEIDGVDADEVLWLPAATPALRDRLRALDIAWVSDSGDFHLRTPWGPVAFEPAGHPPGAADQSPPTRHLAPGTLATLQFLLEHPSPQTQHQIAAGIGLSQPRVSQVLKQLRADGLVERAVNGWHVPDPGRGLQVWLSTATLPAALTMAWYSLAPTREQIAGIQRQAEAEGADVRLCGDWAADQLAPWRSPGLVAVHVDRTLDLEAQGFVPARPDSPTAVVHIGQMPSGWRPDPDVLAAMAESKVLQPIAPVTEVARELLSTGESDAAQAVEVLTSAWLRARTRVVSGRNR